VRVWSRFTGSANLHVDFGPFRLTPPEFFGAWGAMFSKDSVFDTIIFTVPDSLFDIGFGQNISSLTDECLFEVANYANPKYVDYSDCFFRIKKP
jgi:hypothetical protein